MSQITNKTKFFSLLLSGLMLSTPLLANIKQSTTLVDSCITIYADFPKPGVNFYDISGILQNPQAFNEVIDNFAKHYQAMNIEGILALDSRGFLFGAPLAYKLKVPLIMLRKAGKLPGKTLSNKFAKEYGQDVIELQEKSLKAHQRIIIIDDLIATGGTLKAAINIVNIAGAQVVEVASVIELEEFKDNRHLNIPVYSVVKK